MPLGPNLQKLLKAGQSLMQSAATAQCLALVVQKLEVYFRCWIPLLSLAIFFRPSTKVLTPIVVIQ
ncbi:hypothetical protein D3C81_2184560 [compost metagenome]